MNIEEMKKRKKEMGLSNAKVAELADVPLGTVQKVFSGATETPRYDTLLKLEKVFNPGTGAASHVHDAAAPAYIAAPQKQQGEYTLTDYYNMPEDRRVELIDGVIYDLASPTWSHQISIGEIAWEIQSYIKSQNGPCKVIPSPFDVQLDCDDKTMIQPDLMILCDFSKRDEQGIKGAPDFVLEVLSPSTRKKDMNLKCSKYKNAGVREYWMLDCETKTLIVYDFEHENFGKIFGEYDIVPISVLNNECKINLKELFESIE